MRLPINPWAFLLRLVFFFFLTYLAWKPIAPHYARLLLVASRAGVWLTELSPDPLWNHGTTLLIRPDRPTAIFYTQRNFAAFNPPIPPQGIPAEWVMANLVLLIPLMLATPAPSWRARAGRLALALAIALALQVADVIVAIKAFYAGVFAGYWSAGAAAIYQGLDAFVQGFDTQLFPFAIWAGIHFRQLFGHRLQTQSAGTGPDRRLQTQPADTEPDRRLQTQPAGTGPDRRLQTQSAGTGQDHQGIGPSRTQRRRKRKKKR